MSVIIGRAIPDVRDGLKPVHRRILYAMNAVGLGPGSGYRKSATVVGEVLGKYHPHGDASVYDAMVRLAQPFSMRYPLVDGQGNYGSIDGDPAAAYRYTEARLTRISAELLADIDKECVDFQPKLRPETASRASCRRASPTCWSTAPAASAVGMATNIPPHNLGEVLDATVHLIRNPGAPIEDLMRFVPGAGLPHRRVDLRARRHRGRAAHRARDDHHALAHDRREGHGQGRAARADRGHRVPLPGEQGARSRQARRADSREEDRRHQPRYATSPIATECASSSS